MQPLTEDDVQWTTDRNVEANGFTVARAVRLAADLDKRDRLKANMCKYCFYRGSRMVGQAFTPWTCRVCLKEDQHHNTGVPRVCSPCGKKHSLCLECGGDIHDRRRRKATLEEKKNA